MNALDRLAEFAEAETRRRLREQIRASMLFYGTAIVLDGKLVAPEEFYMTQPLPDLTALTDDDLIQAYCDAMPEGENTPEADRIAVEMERRDLAL